MELIEVTFVGELLLCPDALQTRDKFAGAAVAFGVVEPPLAYTGELPTRSACYRSLPKLSG